MDEILSAVFRGLTFGSVYALLAVGLVLTYKTSGVFNLAFGAQAFVAGAVYYDTRDPSRPGRSRVAVLFAVVVLGRCSGSLLDRVLFRYLRTAPPMTRLVTVLGLLVAIPQIVKLWFGVGTTFAAGGHRARRRSTAYNPFGTGVREPRRPRDRRS